MSRISIVLALASLLGMVAGTAHAQLSSADRERLAEQIENAANNLDPSLFPDLQRSQQRVVQRAQAAKDFFNSQRDAANGAAWLDYLKLDPLLQAIESGDESNESLAAIAREAIELRYRLVGTTPGLELTVLRNLRDAVERLIEAIRYRDPDSATETLTRQIESLAERVRQLDDNPSSDDAAVVSALVGVLQSSGQAREVVAALQQAFNRPNLTIMIAEPMVQLAINQNVDQSRPVRDCILGTRIIGNATLNGIVTADVRPSVGAAQIDVALTGHVVSNNVGYNGPVRLRTVGHGDVSVTRTLHVDDAGIRMDPAYSRAVLTTDILAIEHKLKLVRKIARKRAAQQKPKADRIAVEKMRQQVGSQFAEQTNEAAAIAPPDVLADVRPVLQRLSLGEPQRVWSSTDQAIAIDATFRRADQLSSVVARPSIQAGYDAAVQVHESVVDNAVAPVLAGRTMTEAQLDSLLDRVGRKPQPQAAGDEEQTAEDEAPFVIDFARLRPVIFEARDQTLRLGIRGTRFTQGGRELRQAMEITAVYQPQIAADGKVKLVRQGEVNVDFPGGRRLTVTQAGLRRTIQKKFSDVFPAELLDQPLEVPTTVALEAIRGKNFYASLVDARDGWLTIGVQ